MKEEIGKKSFFQLTSQRLLKSDFVVNKNYKDEGNINIVPKLFIDITPFDNKSFETTVKLDLVMFEKDNILYPFYLELSIEGLFSWGENTENIEYFLNVNAPSVLISYLRSVASQLTVFAGYPPLILPLMNFTK